MMMEEACLYDDELTKLEMDTLKLFILGSTIMVAGPLETECWIWTLGGELYGRWRWHDKAYNAHRLSWLAFNGPIPDGLHCLHKCDNGMCVRPDHLYLGTQADNVRDRDTRGPRPRPLVIDVQPEKLVVRFRRRM